MDWSNDEIGVSAILLWLKLSSPWVFLMAWNEVHYHIDMTVLQQFAQPVSNINNNQYTIAEKYLTYLQTFVWNEK